MADELGALASAPLTISLRPSCTWDHYFVTVFPEQPDAVEYVRGDVVESALAAALEALADDDVVEATRILGTCLKRL